MKFDEMYDLGTRQVGDELPLVVQCVNESTGEPEAPAGPPVATLIDRTGAVVTRLALPADLIGTQAGLFRHPLLLGADFDTTGPVHVHYTWKTQGGTAMCRTAGFTLRPGGAAGGAVVSMHPTLRQNSIYLVHELDDGSLRKGKNPR